MEQKDNDKDTTEITNLLEARDIKSMIYTIRGQQVMLDSDLAMLYQVETGNLNKAMKRNQKRFPKELCFELTKNEFDDLNFQNGISREHGGRRKPGYVYAEQGIAMISAVLRSDVAICVRLFTNTEMKVARKHIIYRPRSCYSIFIFSILSSMHLVIFLFVS